MALETGNFIDDLVATNPVSASDLVRYGAGHIQLIKNAIKNSFAGAVGAILVAAADVSATANTITLTPVPALSEYTTRMLVVWLQAVANTGAVTLNISGLGAKAVVSVHNAALVSGDLEAGRVYVGIFDGTSVQLLAVTKNYIDQLAFSAALPAQALGLLTSTGTVASFSKTLLFGLNFSRATVASAATTADIWAALGNEIDWTGTVTCTGFPAAPVAGATRTIICAGAAPFTAGANMLIAGTASGATMTCAANDIVEVYAITTTQFLLYRRRYDGVSIASPYFPRTARTSNTVLAATDNHQFFDITSGTFTQTFTAVASLPVGWHVRIRNSGTGVITISASDGTTNWAMYPGEDRIFTGDGAVFTSEILHAFYYKSSTTYTHIDPPGYTAIGVDLVGGGGSGGAGRRGAVNTARTGGAPGGAPARVQRILTNRVAGTSTTVTIGAGATGAIAQASDSTDGADGVAGGNTTFGSLITAYGGAAGKGGSAIQTRTTGSGAAGAGASANSNTAIAGGLPSSYNIGGISSGAIPSTSVCNVGEGGAGCSTTAGVAGNSEWGGAASGSYDISTTTIQDSGSSLRGVGAGSSGGWVTSGNAMPATANNAGKTGSYANGGGATGGTCGASPTVGGDGAAASTDFDMGNPGAGGGSSITAAAKKGGAGSAPGGPGGGGGASLNTFASGAGGDGAAGRSVVWGIV